MKSIYQYIILSIAIMALFTACEDVATQVKMPPAEKKIVVQCFISPDDSNVSAMVSWSKPIIGTTVTDEPEYIPNATVQISDGNTTQTLQYENSYNMYFTQTNSFKIEAGKKYYLTVTMPDGKKVSANCVVPQVKNSSLVISKIDSSNNSFGGKMITCTFKYKDMDPSVYNYYRLDGKPDVKDPFEDGYVRGEFKQDSELASDNIYKLEFYKDENDNIKRVRAWLICSDYGYYQYHKTLLGAQNNFDLFTEPSIVYSNVEGGLGCFAAYNSFEIEVDL